MDLILQLTKCQTIHVPSVNGIYRPISFSLSYHHLAVHNDTNCMPSFRLLDDLKTKAPTSWADSLNELADSYYPGQVDTSDWKKWTAPARR